MPPTPRNATKVIASNSFWLAIESVFSLVMVFATSIPIARAMGPDRLGYFQWVALATNVSMLMAIGIPSVTNKYMAEYLARGEYGIARAIFDATMALQVTAAILLTCVGELITVLVGDPAHRTVTMIQVLSMLPGMLVAIPSQANNAAENTRANVAGSIVAAVVYMVGVALSLFLHWDLVGLAASFVISRTAEVLVRLPPTWRRVHAYPKGKIPAEVVPAMKSFALQSVGLMLLYVVVWDRSDVFILKHLAKNINQITYFSITFNIVDKMLLMPQVFGHALGVTMLAEFGRGTDRVELIFKAAGKYMYLLGAPMLFGLALVSEPLIRTMYGEKYLACIPLLAVGAGLALFKPLLLPVQYFMRAHNRQKPLLIWTGACGALNIGVDWTLIPILGALGASIGNGIAQASAVIGIWIYAVYRYKLQLDLASLGKITVALLGMAPPILLLNRWLPPIFALIGGPSWLPWLLVLLINIPLGGVIYVGLLRWMNLLDEDDRSRLGHVSGSVPKALRPAFQRLVDFVSHVAPAPVS